MKTFNLNIAVVNIPQDQDQPKLFGTSCLLFKS